MYSVRMLLGLLCLAIAAFAACTIDDSADHQITLHRGLGTDPESLDPQKARSVQAADVLRDINEGLLGHSPDGELVERGAERWQVSDDGLIYTFTIREGARWSSGESLTAEHFVLGLRRLVDPAVASFYAQTVSDVVNANDIISGKLAVESLGVEAVDVRTLKITLRRPVPYLLSLLTHPSTFPAHPAYDASNDGNSARALISNGAYKLESWEPGSLLRLTRNEFYWDNANTAIDRVYHHVLTEEMSELNRYRAGELHVTSSVPPENFKQISEQYGDELRVAPYLGVYYYGFNLTRPPFKDDVDLRSALSMAINREVLIEKFTGRGEAPAYSWVPPGTYNYTPPQLGFAELPQVDRNVIARSFYEQAGYSAENPARIELRYNTSDTQKRIALAVQAMWRDVLGVETTLISEEFQVLLQNIHDRDTTQMFRASWIGDYDDAQSFLALMLSDSPSNMPGYANETYDSLVHRAAEQTDLDRRRLYLEEAERVLLADHAIVPLYFYVSKHLVHPDVHGWEDNVLDYHYSRHLSLSAAH
ncbi:MAG: peptide ABC transporter substrate-binding protein [Gammaproteobacteria bacterium]|nr:peptide ABC transporter substrate-binding protein [Gammaproteobacteria bacterium]